MPLTMVILIQSQGIANGIAEGGNSAQPVAATGPDWEQPRDHEETVQTIVHNSTNRNRIEWTWKGKSKRA